MHIKMAMMVSLLSLGLLSQNTYAQTPSDESIAQWALITDFKNDFEQGVVIGYINSAKTGILLSIKKAYPDATAEQIAAADQLIEDMLQQPAERLSKNPHFYQKVQQVFNKMVKQHFTQQQMDALIEFYSSPIGKSIHKKHMAFNRDLINSLSNIVMEMDELGIPKEELEAIYDKLFPQLHQIFEK